MEYIVKELQSRGIELSAFMKSPQISIVLVFDMAHKDYFYVDPEEFCNHFIHSNNVVRISTAEYTEFFNTKYYRNSIQFLLNEIELNPQNNCDYNAIDPYLFLIQGNNIGTIVSKFSDLPYFVGSKDLVNSSNLKYYINHIMHLKNIVLNNTIFYFEDPILLSEKCTNFDDVLYKEQFPTTNVDKIYINEDKYLNKLTIKLTKLSYKEKIIKEIIRSHQVPVTVDIAAVDFNFNQEKQEIFLIQDMLFSAKQSICNITLQSEAEKVINNEQHSVYCNKSSQIELIFFYLEQVYERLMKLIIIHQKSKTYFDDKSDMKRNGHSIENLIDKCKIRTEFNKKEISFLNLLSLFYSKGRYTTFDEEVNLEYLIEKEKFLNSVGVEDNVFGIKFNFLINELINEIFEKLKAVYVASLQPEINYMNEFFWRYDYYPKNQIVQKMTYCVLEYYVSSNENEILKWFVEEIELPSLKEYSEGSEFIETIQERIEDWYGDKMEYYKDNIKVLFDLTESILTQR